jgi:hypothetical protein
MCRQCRSVPRTAIASTRRITAGVTPRGWTVARAFIGSALAPAVPFVATLELGLGSSASPDLHQPGAKRLPSTSSITR